MKTKAFEYIMIVAFGVIFGLYIITSNDSVLDKKVEIAPATNIETAEPTESNEENTEVVNTELSTIFLVQSGLFNTSDSLSDHLEQLDTQGIPHMIIDVEGANYVYIGLSDSKDFGNYLKSLYIEKGIETYVKEDNMLEDNEAILSIINEFDEYFDKNTDEDELLIVQSVLLKKYEELY